MGLIKKNPSRLMRRNGFSVGLCLAHSLLAGGLFEGADASLHRLQHEDGLTPGRIGDEGIAHFDLKRPGDGGKSSRCGSSHRKGQLRRMARQNHQWLRYGVAKLVPDKKVLAEGWGSYGQKSRCSNRFQSTHKALLFAGSTLF